MMRICANIIQKLPTTQSNKYAFLKKLPFYLKFTLQEQIKKYMNQINRFKRNISIEATEENECFLSMQIQQNIFSRF